MSAKELTNAAMPCIHDLSRRAFLYPQNRDFLVGHVNLYWEVPGGVIMHAPHQLPGIISHRALKDAVLMDCGIDTALVSRLFDREALRERIHVLDRFDPVAYFEMTPRDRTAPPSGQGFPFATHATDHFWRHCNEFNLWLFKHRLFIPADVQPNIGLRSVEEVDAEVRRISADIEATRPLTPSG